MDKKKFTILVSKFLFISTYDSIHPFQALALIELYNAPPGRYKQDVYLLPKKMGKSPDFLFDCYASNFVKN